MMGGISLQQMLANPNAVPAVGETAMYRGLGMPQMAQYSPTMMPGTAMSMFGLGGNSGQAQFNFDPGGFFGRR